MMRRMMFAALLIVGAMVPSQASAGLVFNYTLGADLVALQGTDPSLAADVIAGFAAAGDLWSAILTDNVEVNVTINYAALGAGILGSAGSAKTVVSYAAVAAALGTDATSAADALAVSNLQAGPLDILTNTRAGGVIHDADGSANNSILYINTANAKALGLLSATSPGTDASITFSSLFSFDFDSSNGITAGTFDFVGIAAHEIGHALGFVSGVDTVDFYSGAGPGAGADLNGGAPGIGTIDPYAIFSVLDLYRYSAASVGLGALDLAFGGTKYFSLDGGATSLGLFSTGSFNGDGRQASHWKDGMGLGIMDPTAAPGELLGITGLDVLAFDAIGWNVVVVPEPSSMALIGIGIVGFALRRRKTTTAA